MIHVFSERTLRAMGWDDDKSGHYVPPPLPKWIWITAALAFAGFLALVVFFPG
jgi:hypothetical protein